LKPTTKISIEWCIDDVKAVRPHLTKEQCGKVLDAMDGHHDASIGVNWENLEFWSDELFPMAWRPEPTWMNFAKTITTPRIGT
jgi:hypothetical protein